MIGSGLFSLITATVILVSQQYSGSFHVRKQNQFECLTLVWNWFTELRFFHWFDHTFTGKLQKSRLGFTANVPCKSLDTWGKINADFAVF